MAKYIAFDFDGTLAHDEPGRGKDKLKDLGDPVPEMVELARRFIEDGIEVRIITARAAPEYDDREEQMRILRAWFNEHVCEGYDIVVQAHKCGRMERLYDDRAIGVLRNVGSMLHQYYQDLGQAIGESGIKAYDRRYGIESDACAQFDAGVDDAPIVIDMMTGCEEDAYRVDVREARAFAASILRACDEAEAADKRTT